MSFKRLPMLKETYLKLTQKLEKFKKLDRPTIIEKIAEARSNGDLSENADYHAAREKQGEIEARIQSLENKIALADIIETSVAEAGHIIIGAKVTVENQATKEKETYTLVGAEGVDVLAGKISLHSPIGKGLMGKKVGDLTTINTPRGDIVLKIISFI